MCMITTVRPTVTIPTLTAHRTPRITWLAHGDPAQERASDELEYSSCLLLCNKLHANSLNTISFQDIPAGPPSGILGRLGTCAIPDMK